MRGKAKLAGFQLGLELLDAALEDGSLVIGACSTFTEIRRSALCREHLPALVDAAATIGAVQIQNRATIGGNAVNASPAGDSLPVLLATDAILVARRTSNPASIFSKTGSKPPRG